MIASGVGRLLYPDTITRACTRLDFARVCVMLDSSKLPKYIIIMMPDEDGGESRYKVDVKYEMVPPKCTCCMTLVHAAKDCRVNKAPKIVKPPVTVYLVIQRVLRRAAPKALSMLNAAVRNVRGLNKRDHQLAVKDLVAEFRLHFIGLLETRVCINNVTRIQSFLLLQWKWFMDNASVGNRIWLAWDDNFVDVDMLELGSQCIHVRVNILAVHEPIIFIVIYDSNKVADRRDLWGPLEMLATQYVDLPWIVRVPTQGIYERGWIGCSLTIPGRRGFRRNSIPALPDAHLITRQCIQNIWQHKVIGAPLYVVTWKLKALKLVFREQRRKKGNLMHNVQLAKGFLETAQILASLNRQDELFIFLEHCCRLIYFKAVKLEQIMLQQRAKMEWMKGGNQCSRVFFRKIAQRRTSRRILQMNDAHGTTHTEPNTMSHEFVAYYQSLLGRVRRREVMGFQYMRPWVQHVLSYEEASQFVLPFTPEDVKLAVFDIADNKALRPDGFSSGFFKAAWPVVGNEITNAVLNFFTMGRLLKHINSKLLALIPKRCALKVDIRKAYDIVECDFLLAVLQLFGFPVVFIKRIEECVTTTSFSVGMNEKPHGFFAGTWGLQQGDPLSPYLFVLVMEVMHPVFLQMIDQDGGFTFYWKYEPSRIFQLGFVDDLLLFCCADIDSIRVFKDGLDRFGTWLVLRLNVDKSHLIISRFA
ncbi:UNVERIFIED_CONTAM: hypothetical protein Sindi_2288200 [Sesamum indicum]